MNQNVFELIDQVARLDVGGRGMAPLYDAARQRTGAPLSLAAARLLQPITAGDSVVLLTGSMVRGWVSLELGETDGPLGTAAMARALSYASGAVPIVLTDETLLRSVAATLEAAGLIVVSASQARAASANPRFTSVAVVDTCSCDTAEALGQAQALLDHWRPRAVVSIERAGLTVDGTYRSSAGLDYSTGRARLDEVVAEAARRGLPTIGIGDYGNEIGMGAIRAAVEQHMHNGARVCAQLATDVVFPAGVSNWGCYAVLAALALLRGQREFVHAPSLEAHLLRSAPQLGMIDGLTGRREPTADGLPVEAHVAVVSLLETIVRRGA